MVVGSIVETISTPREASVGVAASRAVTIASL
jgi:hypothetical protein